MAEVSNVPIAYLDSSVLIAFLYEKQEHPARFEQVRRLVSAIRERILIGLVSFYVLPELYGHVQANQPENEINLVFRLSLVELFGIPLTIVPFLNREDLNRLRQQFVIADSDDVRHVASALFNKCDAIITFDHDFQQVANLIPAHTPAEFLATLTKKNNVEE
ncbi:MAG: type II toxin-antitoxin system VapC family toxin [Chloroflexi bacterium]|nr:type II toxin-antitoxin system VapC family toxin [Chloroflexota bacterium]